MGKTFGEILDDMTLEDDSVEDMTLDPAEESAIFIGAMMDSYGVEETLEFVMENANELYSYGLISDAEAAVEAARNIVRLNKDANFNKVHALACLNLAKKANYPGYKKYKFHREKFLQYREEIMQKFGPQAKTVARKSIQNSKRNASRMKSKHGSNITQQMDRQMKKFDSKTSTAIAKQK